MLRKFRKKRQTVRQRPRKLGRLEGLEERTLMAADFAMFSLASSYNTAAVTPTTQYTATYYPVAETSPSTGEVYDDDISGVTPAGPVLEVDGGEISITGTNRSDANDYVEVKYINGGAQLQFTLQVRDAQGNLLSNKTRVVNAAGINQISFDAYAGNDTFVNRTNIRSSVDGGLGNDSLVGGNGNDTIHGGAGNDTINGGTGNDVLFGEDNNDVIRGGDGHDVIRGGGGNDSLQGQLGNDTIDGDSGHDQIFGESGNDALYGGTGNDTIKGGADHDAIFGENGFDVLEGESGNDTLRGGDGRDSLFGGGGSDWLDGGKDGYLDFLNGGSGRDTFADHSARWWEFWSVGEVDHNDDYDPGAGDRFGRF